MRARARSWRTPAELGYVTGGVKKLKIAAVKGDGAAPADALQVYDGTYQIFRPLYINRVPGKR